MSHHIPSVSWQQARQILHEQGLEIAHHVKTESLPLLATIDHYLADDVYSVMPVPHYSSSAMDGYAVAGAPPWRLVTPAYPEDSRANIHRLTVPIAPGEATPILTGGLLPEGAEAIVREEHSRLYEGAEASSRPGVAAHLETQSSIHYLDMAEGFEPPAPGADIRHAGVELERGELLARHGDRISARMAAFLGMNGFDELPVYAPIPVRCAFTGNEVITFGVPAPGQVRDAFGGFMEHAIISAGCEARPSIRLADVESEFRTFLSTSTARVLVFTGGSAPRVLIWCVRCSTIWVRRTCLSRWMCVRAIRHWLRVCRFRRLARIRVVSVLCWVCRVILWRLTLPCIRICRRFWLA